jgi:hypothetical protein
MNQRIKELAEQAGAVFEKTNGLNDCPQDSLVDDEIQKFAELMINDCLAICERGTQTQTTGDGVATLIKLHFGIKE